jgi:hypothetical protein
VVWQQISVIQAYRSLSHNISVWIFMRIV